MTQSESDAPRGSKKGSGRAPRPGGARVPEGATREILTDKEIAKLKATQRRRLVLFGILGIIMLVLGFLAGRYLREQSRNSSDGLPLISRVESDSRHDRPVPERVRWASSHAGPEVEWQAEV